MALERLLNGGALHALAASVNQADFAQAAFMRGPDVLLDDRHHVARVKGVKVDGRFDGNAMRLIHNGGGPGQAGWDNSSNEAVTMVLMPPRTVKSPVTVMRRG